MNKIVFEKLTRRTSYINLINVKFLEQFIINIIKWLVFLIKDINLILVVNTIILVK